MNFPRIFSNGLVISIFLCKKAVFTEQIFDMTYFLGGSKNHEFFIIKKNDEILIKILIKKSWFFRILKKVAFFRVFTEQTLRFYPFFWTRTPKNPKFSRVTFWGSNSSENHQNRCVFPECARVCFSCFFRTFNFC